MSHLNNYDLEEYDYDVLVPACMTCPDCGAPMEENLEYHGEPHLQPERLLQCVNHDCPDVECETCAGYGTVLLGRTQDGWWVTDNCSDCGGGGWL